MDIQWYRGLQPADRHINYQSRQRTGATYQINVEPLFRGNWALWESALVADNDRRAAEYDRHAAEEQACRDRQAAKQAAKQAAEAAFILEQQREQAIKERDEWAAEADVHRAKLLEVEAKMAEITQRLPDRSRRRWLCWPRQRRQPSTAQESVPPPYEGKA